MHLELPNTRLASFKDFAKHYLMIVLSILTALGLEAWIEHAHHTHAAAAASRQIVAELHDNLTNLHWSLQHNRQALQSLGQLEADVTQAIQAKRSNTDINQYIQAHRKQFTISIDWPGLPSQAWDVAVANQSASWIDVATLRRYAIAYARQRSASDWLTHNSTVVLNAPHMSSLQTRINLGLDVDPVDFLTVLQQMMHTEQEVDSHLEQLAPQLVAALPAATGSATVGR